MYFRLWRLPSRAGSLRRTPKFRRHSDDGRNIGLGVSMFCLCVLVGALVTFLQPYRQIALGGCAQVESRQPSYRGRWFGPCQLMARIDALDSGLNATVLRVFDRASDTAKTADASLAYGGQWPRIGVAMANARVL